MSFPVIIQQTTTENIKSTTRHYILASLFAALTAVGAFIKIPTPPVPITLQDFFVILSGSVLGPLFGALSQFTYLAIGLAGVPVFSQGGGPGYVLQPTFGYLMAFPVAAYVVGMLTRKPPTPPSLGRMVLAHTIGAAVIFLLGVSVLYLNFRFVVMKPIALSHALWVGCVVFLPGTLIKVLGASVLARRIRSSTAIVAE